MIGEFSMKKTISADALKWVALITMFIDHIGAVIIEHAPMYPQDGRLLAADYVLRYTGRLAFPIFCFLLVEGFGHTRSKIKYFKNLALFAVISEIPFDLANCGELSFEKQNVFFTLAAGYLSIWALEYFTSKKKKFFIENYATEGIIIFLVLAVLAELTHTDYGMLGVALIVVLWGFREERRLQCIFGSLVLWMEITHVFAFLMIYFYNGVRKMKRGKYFFYAFYPLHLLLLYGIFVLLW